MATKITVVNGEERQSSLKKQEPGAGSKLVGGVSGKWNEFTRFLSDVRAEMRKVVTPSRREVQATTTVVLVAVFLFGVYFFVVDGVFAYGMGKLLNSLGGTQH